LVFPILDGIPFLLADPGRFIADNLLHLLRRDDLSADVESLIGDAAGPGSAFDTVRHHLASYAQSHYGDRAEPRDPDGGSLLGPLRRGLAFLHDAAEAGPTLDLGCAVGRGSFELAARGDRLVLGVDVNVTMLRLARALLGDGPVAAPRRRIGVVYDRMRIEAGFAHAERVDFWCCDALALPFAPGGFGLAVAMNLLDCVGDPRRLLGEIEAMLALDGAAVLATPYDWAPNATSPIGWIGGHSQRGPAGGAAEPLLRQLMTPGVHPQSLRRLRLFAEDDDVPWRVRLHDRSTVEYRLHLVAARA
jgi:SAM-dependent methyltransferase